MVYRALGLGIVLFWLGMTGLLVRTELFSNGGANQAPVPVALVFKQMFLHEQSSDLALYRQRKWLGAFHVQPRHAPADPASGGARSVTVNGGSTLDFLGLPNWRAILRATFDLDEQQTVRAFTVSANIRETGVKEESLGLTFDGRPPANQYHYLVRRGEVVQKEATGAPEELLADPALSLFGFDPRTLVLQVFAQATGASQAEARRSTMPLNGEMIETYLVTFHHGGTLDTTLQTTQQGQILALTTFAGYDFYDETITP